MYTADIDIKKGNTVVRKLTINISDEIAERVSEGKESRVVINIGDIKDTDIACKHNSTDVLVELGMDPSIKGFTYIVTALKKLKEDPELINNIVGGLYVEIGKEHNATGSQVERCIRHAVEKIWVKKNKEKLYYYLKTNYEDNKRPITNSRFLALCNIYIN